MNKEIQKIIKKLTNTVGISGNEIYSGITEEIFKIVKKINSNTEKDKYGNVVSTIGRGQRKILVDAHLDEVGFMVSKISNEKIKLVTIGDINVQKIDNSKARILGKNIRGKIVQYNSDAVFEVLNKKMRKNVSTGDIIAFDRIFSIKEDTLNATALDNRAGCAIAICLIDELVKQNQLDIQVVVSFTAGEEKNQSVIDKIAFKHGVDFGIIIDAAYAKPVNFGTDNMTIPDVGNGCAIQHLGENFIVDKAITSILEKKFIEKGIRFQKEIPIPEFGRTNFSKLQQSGKPGCVINVPVKNQHTQESEMSIVDFNSTHKAVMATIELFQKGVL